MANKIDLDTILDLTGQFDPMTVAVLDLSDKGLEEIPDCIGECMNVVYINLSNNRIEGGGLKRLVMLSCLSHLDLSNNKITKVTDDLRGLRSLRTINLDGNAIRSVSDLKGLASCPQLERVSIRRCPLEKESFVSLATKLRAIVPGLKRLNGIDAIEESKMPLEACKLSAMGACQMVDETLSRANAELSKPWIEDELQRATDRLYSHHFESHNMRMIDDILSLGKGQQEEEEALRAATVAGS
ncbi:Splicing factor 3B subunit 1 [Perkinsus chesapeaki]|uniref:Splicing factor 3B subunit 1 n=1 Tax=Perkinsus chesapeaki TaxID=330153 RepID=A0A7J6MJA3_PERCH|nr:Splicing factor 3B subunit 1 [Perkinsus chesapeaki]